jgi:hypothetical protein
VGVLAIDPEPRTLHWGIGGHFELSLGGGPVGDLLIEVSDDHCSDAVGAALVQGGVRRRGKRNLGLVGRPQCGELRHFGSRNAIGPTAGESQRVGTPVAQRHGGLPDGVIRSHDSLDRFAGIVDHADISQLPRVGFDHDMDHDMRERIDVTGIGAGRDRHLCWPGRFRGNPGAGTVAVGASWQRRNLHSADHSQEDKYGQQESAKPPNAKYPADEPSTVRGASSKLVDPRVVMCRPEIEPER